MATKEGKEKERKKRGEEKRGEENLESIFEFWGKIFSVISDRMRLLILVVLFDSAVTGEVGSGSCTFSELRKITGLPKNTLSYHLKILRQIMLIEKKTVGTYELTKEGHDLLGTL